jgi:hypothetical protein
MLIIAAIPNNAPIIFVFLAVASIYILIEWKLKNIELIAIIGIKTLPYANWDVVKLTRRGFANTESPKVAGIASIK